MLNGEPMVQECDATKNHSSNAAGPKRILQLKILTMNNFLKVV